jgi:hypothetical protein
MGAPEGRVVDGSLVVAGAAESGSRTTEAPGEIRNDCTDFNEEAMELVLIDAICAPASGPIDAG